MQLSVRTMNKRLPILLLPILLAACTLGPDYQAPENPSPPAWRNPPAQTSELWPSQDWWQGFGSSQLDLYIAAAQNANTDLAAAEARIREADAQARIAGAPLLPSLSLGANVVHERQPSAVTGRMVTSTAYEPGLTASYEGDFWGKNAATARAAEATALASRYDQVTVSLTVMTGVATTYFRTLELHDRLVVAENNLASASSACSYCSRKAGTAASSVATTVSCWATSSAVTRPA